jgi:hypothetical protein
LNPWDGKPSENEAVSEWLAKSEAGIGFIDLLFKRIVSVVQPVIHTLVEEAFEYWCEIPMKKGPICLTLGMFVLPHPTVLQCIGETRVEAMADHCLTISDTKIFGTMITLSREWHS